MEPDCSIDPQRLSNFLDTLSPLNQEIVKKIVAHTLYIRRDEMIAMVLRCIYRLHSITSLYNLYIPSGKIGSEHWLLLEIESHLSPFEVFTKETLKDLSNPYPIVIIDDAIYSSAHMCGIIDEDIRYSHPWIKNKVYCVVAITSSLRVQCTMGPYFNAEIIADKSLDHLQLKSLFHSLPDDYMYSYFGCETGCVLPVYFSHKIANEFGSYSFYHQIVKEKPRRNEINKITWKNMKDLIDRLRKKRDVHQM